MMGDLTGDSSGISAEGSKVSASNATSGKKIVYVWDMDETLILLKCLLNGTYAEAFNGLKDVEKGIEIGKTWENYILQLCDDHFFYEQVENHNTPSLDALTQYDDGRELSSYNFNQDNFDLLHDDTAKRKLAYRHRIVAQKYKKGLHGILDQETIKRLDDLYELTDSYTDRWLSSARAFLEGAGGINGSNNSVSSVDGVADSVDANEHIHVLVTSGSLVPSLIKCLLFRLDHLLPQENVYSSWDVGKLQCFSWIKERFDSARTQFCVIGDGWEECQAALTMKWPFVQIDPLPGDGHRFPGLTLEKLGYYLSVVYGSINSGDEG